MIKTNPQFTVKKWVPLVIKEQFSKPNMYNKNQVLYTKVFQIESSIRKMWFYNQEVAFPIAFCDAVKPNGTHVVIMTTTVALFSSWKQTHGYNLFKWWWIELISSRKQQNMFLRKFLGWWWGSLSVENAWWWWQQTFQNFQLFRRIPVSSMIKW